MKNSLKRPVEKAMSLILSIAIFCGMMPMFSLLAEASPNKLQLDFESNVSFSNMNIAMGSLTLYNSTVNGFNAANVYEGNGSFKITHGSSSGNLNCRFTGYDFKAGSKYRLSFNYKSSAAMWTYFQMPDSFNTTLNSSTWASYSRTVTFASDTTYFEIGTTARNATLYIDNLSLIPIYEISVESSDTMLGTADASVSEATDGDEVTFTAVPTESGKFLYWKDSSNNIVSSVNPYATSTITDELALTAVFENLNKSYQLLSFEGAADLSNQQLSLGTAAVYTASSSADDKVFNGTGSLELAHNANSGNLRIFVKDATFKAGSKYQISLNINSDKAAWFYIVNSNSYGFTATAGEWKEIKKTVTFESDCNYLEIGTTTADCTSYIDEIEIREYLKVTAVADDAALGSVTVSPSEVVYGSSVVLTAAPKSGSSFMRWVSLSGVEQSTENPYTINNVTTPISLTADFEATLTNESYLDFEIETPFSNMNTSMGTAERYVSSNRDDENVYEGNGSFKLAHNDNSGILYVYFRNFKLKANVTYKISFWYKTDVSTWAFVVDGSRYGITLATGGWKKIEKTVVPTKDTDYLEFGAYQKSSVIFLDNISVNEVITVGARSDDEEKGTAEISESSVILGNSVTFTAIPSNGCSFVGWKKENSDEIISTMLSYSVNSVNEPLSLVAYFTGEPLPVSLQTEDFENDVSYSNMNMSSGEMSVYNALNANDSNVYAGNNSFVLKRNNNSGNLNVYFKGFKFKSGNTYRISFWYKVSDKAWCYIADSSKNGINLEANGWRYFEKDITFDQNRSYLEIGTTTKDITLYLDNLRADAVYSTAASSENDELGSASAADTSAFAGGEMTFTAKPKTGCSFVGWLYEGENNIISSDSVYTIKNIYSNVALVARFTGTPSPTELQTINFEDDIKIQNRNNAAGEAYLYKSSLEGYHSSNVYSGNGSLILKHNEKSGNLQVYIQDVELYANKIYEVGFYYKTSKRAWFYCNSVNTNTWLESKEWAYYSTRIIPGKNLNYLEIGVTSADAVVFIDNITVRYKETYAMKAESTNTALGAASVSTDVAAKGDSVQFIAAPISGYHLSAWKTADGTTVSRSKSYTAASVNGDLTLFAYFEKNSSPTGKQDFENPIEDTMDKGFSWHYEGEDGYSNDNVHGGKGSLKFVSNNNWQFYTADASILLEPNTAYEITLWYKTEAATDLGNKTVSFIDLKGIDEANGRAYLTSTGGEWQKVKKSFKTNDFSTTIRIGMYQLEKDLVTVYFDDISVEKVNIYKEIPNIQTIDFDTKVPQTAYFTWNTDKRYTRNGSAGSLKFDGTAMAEGHSGYTLPDLEVEPFSDYTVSVWVKGIKSGGFGSVQLYLGSYTSYLKIGKCMNDWTELTMNFSTGNIESNILGLQIIGYQNDAFYIDDLTLTRLESKGSYCEELYNLIKNGSFEKEINDSNFGTLSNGMSISEATAVGGQKSLQISSEFTSYTLPITVKKSGRYIFAFSSKKSDGVLNVSLTKDSKGTPLDFVKNGNSSILSASNSEEWQRNIITVDITTPNNTLYLNINGVNASAYLDDFSLFDIRYIYEEDPNDYTVYSAYDFEATGAKLQDNDKVIIDNSETATNFPYVLVFSIVFVVALALAVTAIVLVRRRKNAK